MKLKIAMSLDSAAFFEGDPMMEIKRTFERIVESINTTRGSTNAVLDSNGNTIGNWAVWD